MTPEKDSGLYGVFGPMTSVILVHEGTELTSQLGAGYYATVILNTKFNKFETCGVCSIAYE